MAAHPQSLAVQNAVAEKGGWGQPAPAGVYRGLAHFRAFGSYVAAVAEVSVTPKGEVTIHRIVAGTDCGYAVNPDQIAAKLFPREATANKTIFYDHGTPRTIREVYKSLIAQHEGPASLHPGYAVQQMMATTPTTGLQVAATGTSGVQPVPLAPVRTTAEALAATAASPADAGAQQATQSPLALAPLAASARSASQQAAAAAAARGEFYVVEQQGAGTPLLNIGGHSRPVTADAAAAPVIPSRIGRAGVSFVSLFNTDAASGSPVGVPVEQGQSAFFTQLYGQQ